MEWYITRLLEDNLTSGDLGGPGSPGKPPEVAPLARGYSYLQEGHLDEIDNALRPIRKNLLALGAAAALAGGRVGAEPGRDDLRRDGRDGRPPTRSCCSATRSSRPAGATGTWRRSCARRACPASTRAAGTCTARSRTGRPAATRWFRRRASRCRRSAGTSSAAPWSTRIAASAFTTPTVNGYRRRRPYSLAPDKITWGFDNRAAMIRVISSPGDEASHVENRVGEPAANPYLYVAAQVLSGLDGVTNKSDPGPISEDPYASDRASLPTSLADALDALEGDAFFRRALGDRFVDYIVTMKRSETTRYAAHLAERTDADPSVVTDWEHREYFELF